MILNCIAFFCLELVLDRKFADVMLVNHNYVIVTIYKLREVGGLITCSDWRESWNNYTRNSSLIIT